MSNNLKSVIFAFCTYPAALLGFSQAAQSGSLNFEITPADITHLGTRTISYTAEPPSKHIVAASTLLGTSSQKYGYGHFVTHSKYSLSSGTPNGFINSSLGQEQSPLVFTQHDAVTVQLLYSAADSAGHMLVTGRARKSTGYVTQFIAGQNLDTTHPQILHTGHFLALAACQASDGSLWGVGNVMPASATDEAFSLKHFTFTGSKLGSYTPPSKLRINRLPIPSSQIFLGCLGNDVVLYDGYNSQVTKYSSRSSSAVTMPISEQNTAGRIANGFALGPNGVLYASWKRRSSRSSAVLMALDYRANSNPRWTTVNTDTLRANSMKIVGLLGVENSSLVLSLRGMYTPASSIVWSRVTASSSLPPLTQP